MTIKDRAARTGTRAEELREERFNGIEQASISEMCAENFLRRDIRSKGQDREIHLPLKGILKSRGIL